MLSRLLLTLYLLSGSCLAVRAQPTPLPLDSLRARAAHALRTQRYAAAATLLQQQAQAEPLQATKATAFYNLACVQALAGQPQPALHALAQAQRLGFNKLALVRTDADLTSLRTTPQFAHVLRRMEQANARLTDPSHAQLVTRDIDLFWRAYDLAAQDPAHAEAIYQREYFAKGSPGLQDYYQLKIGSIQEFVDNQRRKPAFYRAIRPNTLRIAALAPQIRAGFYKLQALYPGATFPNVYFVIGSWTSAGTVSGAGLLVGADQLCGTPTTPVQELSVWGQRNLGTLAQLPYVVAHEHIHSLQPESPDRSLLRGAINEGMADFLAELTAGQQPNARLQPYGLAHEQQLWAAFTQEMASNDWRNWIANSTQETADKPADLGYFVGYRICQSYYQEMADKKQAVYDMLHIRDFPAFLAKSRYAEKLAAR